MHVFPFNEQRTKIELEFSSFQRDKVPNKRSIEIRGIDYETLLPQARSMFRDFGTENV
jgi:hypothetical protein